MITNREDLDHFWPLSKHFIYAPEVGLSLRSLRADWWNEWINDERRERYILPSALGFAFLKHLEKDKEDDLLENTSLALQNSGGRVRLALEHREPLSSKRRQTFASAGDIAPEDMHEEILLSHSQAYWQSLVSCWEKKDNFLVAKDTELSRETIAEALFALKESLRKTDEGIKNGYASYTIPFHSGLVEREVARDGGLINTLATAALYALRTKGINRVAIVNVSTKHHIGTQDIFYSDPRVFTLSLHHPLPSYTGTGGEEDIGLGRGEGLNQNIEWQEGKNCTRRLSAFSPDLIFLRLDESLSSLFPRMLFLSKLNKPLVVEASSALALKNWDYLIS